MDDREELESMKGFAEALAREVGDIQRTHLGQSPRVEYKGTVDLVTQIDRRCEAVIIDRISTRFPDHDILAEEGEGAQTGSAFLWYIDPLDGTTNYVHGYPCFSVSMGLAFEGRRVLGVVFDPLRDELFSAVTGRGAFLNDTKVSVSRIRNLDHSLLATGFPYDIRESAENNIDHFARFAVACQGIRRDGSAALNLCYVATGRLDGFWEMKLNPWDLAAGVFIVEEAGGKVSDFRGDPFEIDSGEVLATNGRIHGQMIHVLNGGGA